jgi:hypothetical protein
VAGARSPWPCWPPPAPSQAFAGRSAAGRAATAKRILHHATCSPSSFSPCLGC